MKAASRLLICLLLLFPLSATTADVPPGKPIHVANGATEVDFTADGKADLIVSAHRENFNAHSFEVVTFYMYGENFQHQRILQIVPIVRPAREDQELIVSGGADCVLHDFRLLAGPKPNTATLVVADREFGATMISVEQVTFSYFELQHNAEGEPGAPEFAFVQSRSEKSTGKYCDVGEAFKKELQLAP